MTRTTDKFNGWLKVLSGLIILAVTVIATAIVSVKVLEDDVVELDEEVQDLVPRVRENETLIKTNQASVQKDIEHIKEKLDEFIRDQKAVNTQVIEYLRTSNP